MHAYEFSIPSFENEGHPDYTKMEVKIRPNWNKDKNNANHPRDRYSKNHDEYEAITHEH